MISVGSEVRVFLGPPTYHNINTRGISSAGRAPDLHSGGQRFDPAILHQNLRHLAFLNCKYYYYQYLYPIVFRYFFENNQNKNLIYYRKNFFLCINQAFKGDWRMPWHCKTMKDVVYCDKFRGAVCML